MSEKLQTAPATASPSAPEVTPPSGSVAPLKESWLVFFRKVSWRIKLQLIGLVGLGSLIVIGALTIIVMILLGRGSHPAQHAKAPKQEATGPAQPYTHTYELLNLSIALLDRPRRKTSYAQFSMVLDCPDAESKRAMQLHRAKLLDTVFQVATQFFVEDFSTPQGFETFKGSLNAEYRVMFKELAPRDVAIRDWVLH